LEEPEAAAVDMAAVATGGGAARVWWRRLWLVAARVRRG
jgi:hypothetical protein